MNNPAPSTITEDSITKKEFQAVALKAETEVAANGGLRLAFSNFAELEKFSNFMAISNFVPKHLRNKQADCLAVLLQAMRWEMDPFAVAQKTYFVNDGMAYEAQLVNAIINSRAPIKGRPKLTWSGEGDGLKCKVMATFKGEDEPAEFEAEIKPITTKNSPLWKQQPKQQLGYFALRAWARLYCPDVIMGVYTKEEMESGIVAYGADNAVDITPVNNNSTLDNINEQIKAEAVKKMENKQPELIELDPIVHNAADAKPKAEKPKTLSDWQAALQKAENSDMLEDLHMEAASFFAGDNISINVLNAARDKRDAAMKKEADARPEKI